MSGGINTNISPMLDFVVFISARGIRYSSTKLFFPNRIPTLIGSAVIDDLFQGCVFSDDFFIDNRSCSLC